MIAEVKSPAAQIAENARRALARIADESTRLAESVATMQAEQDGLQTERAEALARRRELAALVEAAAADRRHAELEQELSAGTQAEPVANEHAAAASHTWDTARADLAAHDDAWRQRAPEIESRLGYLLQSIQESAEMFSELQVRQSQVQAIFEQAHNTTGADIRAAIVAEHHALDIEEEEAQASLADVQARKQAHTEQIAPRLSEWPRLARETLGEYLPVEPGATARALSLQRELMVIVGNEINHLDLNLLQAYLTHQALPFWHLSQYGPRSKYLPVIDRAGKVDEELKIFEKLLDNLAATISNLRARDLDAQITARLTGHK